MIILRKYTNCTEEERKALVSTDISIACVDKRIATLKGLLDTSLREICFNRIKELEGYKAKLHYEKLLFAFPKAEGHTPDNRKRCKHEVRKNSDDCKSPGGEDDLSQQFLCRDQDPFLGRL